MKSYIPFFYAGGVTAIGFGIHFMRRFYHYSHFPTTDAIVLSNEVVSGALAEGGIAHYAEVSFSYTIDGHSFTSERLYSLGVLGFGGASPRSAEMAIVDFTVGSSIRVFYDPSNPSFAFIRNGPLLQIYAPIIIGIVFCAITLFFHLKA